MAIPRLAIGPTLAGFAENAVRAGGGIPVKVGEQADALVWLRPPRRRRVGGGAEAPARAALGAAALRGRGEHGGGRPHRSDRRMWTCAKGSYAEPVAEHALLLALAGLRLLPERIRAHTLGAAGRHHVARGARHHPGRGRHHPRSCCASSPPSMSRPPWSAARTGRCRVRPGPSRPPGSTTSLLRCPGGVPGAGPDARDQAHHRRPANWRPWTNGPGSSTWPVARTCTPTPW